MSQPRDLDFEAGNMLTAQVYVWSDLHYSFVRRRWREEALGNYMRQFPVAISFEELSDNEALTPGTCHKNRIKC